MRWKDSRQIHVRSRQKLDGFQVQARENWKESMTAHKYRFGLPQGHEIDWVATDYVGFTRQGFTTDQLVLSHLNKDLEGDVMSTLL